MGLFDKRVKIDARLMAKVIYELLDERCHDIFQLFSAGDYDDDFHAYNLMFYSHAINFYLIGNILSHGNSSNKTALTMSTALDLLCLDLSKTIGIKDSTRFKTDFSNALVELGNLCSTPSAANLDNSFSRLSKFLLGKIYLDGRYTYDAFCVLELSEIISGWISDSMFLVEKYKLIK